MTENEHRNSINDTVFYSYAANIGNPEKLSIEQLRKFNGLELVPEQDALEIIDELYKLSIITYKIFN